MRIVGSARSAFDASARLPRLALAGPRRSHARSASVPRARSNNLREIYVHLLELTMPSAPMPSAPMPSAPMPSTPMPSTQIESTGRFRRPKQDFGKSVVRLSAKNSASSKDLSRDSSASQRISAQELPRCPSIASGLTRASNSAAVTRPSLIASSRKVVWFLCADLAISAALS
jgi:hypothetical protein